MFMQTRGLLLGETLFQLHHSGESKHTGHFPQPSLESVLYTFSFQFPYILWSSCFLPSYKWKWCKEATHSSSEPEAAGDHRRLPTLSPPLRLLLRLPSLRKWLWDRLLSQFYKIPGQRWRGHSGTAFCLFWVRVSLDSQAGLELSIQSRLLGTLRHCLPSAGIKGVLWYPVVTVCLHPMASFSLIEIQFWNLKWKKKALIQKKKFLKFQCRKKKLLVVKFQFGKKNMILFQNRKKGFFG